MEAVLDLGRIIELHEIRNVNDTTYTLRFKREGIDFVPGQHIALGLPNSGELREYSIYSGKDEKYMEVLIREVDGGKVSPGLRRKDIKDKLIYRKPKGHFTLGKEPDLSKKYLFIATGTGIAPFHSFVKSYEGLDYKILHGVRNATELYDKHDYDRARYVGCTSREASGDYHGRVSDYLRQNNEDEDRVVYLCGNFQMIQEVRGILIDRGFNNDNIFTEIYF